ILSLLIEMAHIPLIKRFLKEGADPFILYYGMSPTDILNNLYDEFENPLIPEEISHELTIYCKIFLKKIENKKENQEVSEESYEKEIKELCEYQEFYVDENLH